MTMMRYHFKVATKKYGVMDVYRDDTTEESARQQVVDHPLFMKHKPKSITLVGTQLLADAIREAMAT